MNQMHDITIEEMRANLGVKVKAAKDRGRKMVGCFCSYFPKELVLAAGAIPIGLCGSTDQPITYAEDVLPRDLCPTVKSTYGLAVSGNCPLFFLADCVVGESTCDGRQKMYELLGREKPMFIMDLPKLQDEEEARLYWREQVRKLKVFLEGQLATRITDDKLRSAIREVNEARRLLKAVHATRKHHPVPITGVELLGVTTVEMHNHVDHADYLASLRKVLAMLEARIKNRQFSCAPDTPRIMWTGLGASWGSEKVLRLVEECGGVVVCQEGCGGITRADDLVDEDGDPLAALADRYLRVSCACMTPNTTRFRQIEALLDEYRIEGVVNFTRQFCALYDIESHRVKEIMAARRGIPYLHIITDYSQSDIGQLRTRIEGFLEQVVHQRRERPRA
jgi:benzoyl-CoA reductase/2-hydroxyglutaryl-CoA dehydratase subunit BcrC/BadD/HgdB